MIRYVLAVLAVLLTLAPPAQAARSADELRASLRKSITTEMPPYEMEAAVKVLVTAEDIPALVTLLGDSDQAVVQGAGAGLVTLGPPALAALNDAVAAQGDGASSRNDTDAMRATKLAADAAALRNLPFDNNVPTAATDADRKEAEALDPALRARLEERFKPCAKAPHIYAARKDGDVMRLWYEMGGVTDMELVPRLDSAGKEIRNHDIVETDRILVEKTGWSNAIYSLKTGRFIGVFNGATEADIVCSVD